MVVNDGMMDSGGGGDICEYPVAYLVLMFSPALLYHDLYIDPRLLACSLMSSFESPPCVGAPGFDSACCR